MWCNIAQFKCVYFSILVGAPNELGSGGARTGAVYRCELGSSDNNCTRVASFDNYTGDANTAWSGQWKCIATVMLCTRVDQQRFGDPHDDDEGRVDGQLLGYSIDAIGDFAIVSITLHLT